MGGSIDHYRDWARGKRPILFDLVRIYLGVALFVKGMQFVSQREQLARILENHDLGWFVPTALAHYIPAAHLGGGFLLAIGLMTRVAAAFQIPILFGAAFVIYMPQGFFTYSQDFEFAALVLFLLVIILIYGGGRLSADYYLYEREREAAELLPSARRETSV